MQTSPLGAKGCRSGFIWIFLKIFYDLFLVSAVIVRDENQHVHHGESQIAVTDVRILRETGVSGHVAAMSGMDRV